MTGDWRLTGNWQLTTGNSQSVARWEQYELWALKDNEWSMVGSFMDLDVAATVARARRDRVRLLRAIYDNSTRLEQEVLLEIGATRKAG